MPPDSTYRFKHTLVQDAAYESLLKSRRRELHRAAARALNDEFQETAEAQPELLAYHLTEAGENERLSPPGNAPATARSPRGLYRGE
jgi:Predicted ATPase